MGGNNLPIHPLCYCPLKGEQRELELSGVTRILPLRYVTTGSPIETQLFHIRMSNFSLTPTWKPFPSLSGQ